MIYSRRQRPTFTYTGVNVLLRFSFFPFFFFEVVLLTYHPACSPPIPYLAFKVELISASPFYFHLASRLKSLCYSASSQTYDLHKSLRFHFFLRCYHPLHFRATKKLLTSSSKWQQFHWCVPRQSRWK